MKGIDHESSLRFHDRWISRDDFQAGGDAEQPPNMMDTFEKFKRQAVKSVVPGDDPSRLSGSASSKSKLGGLLSWQLAALLSVLCVGAAVVGVILGVLYWPKSAFGERTEPGDEVGKAGIGGVDSEGDRSLAHSAQMYHYQQQKQQMLAMQQASGKVRSLDSNSDSGDECDEPDVNVYECPGLAVVSELEVKNPLYKDEPTEASGTQNTGADVPK
ncbi:unnamed protein product [Mesocestoides corti]|uniref:Neural proliferation differentiation and control protein 1 n=1 Tax=Mesocestoides corti TaxID=53468 RepID=A0A158QVW3_MESCO|nr:unnamed protein product [Mesocestoides corti]